MKLIIKKYSADEIVNLCQFVSHKELVKQLAIVKKAKASNVPSTLKFVQIDGNTTGDAGTYTATVSGGSAPADDTPEMTEFRAEVQKLIVKYCTHTVNKTIGFLDKRKKFRHVQVAIKEYKTKK